ncbi:MAG: hypothetical protein ACYS8Z_16230 [Planctomycetota bacterium]
MTKLTNPEHIPYLIEQVDRAEYWRADELQRCWFPVASESYLEQIPDVSKQAFWSMWWENTQAVTKR